MRALNGVVLIAALVLPLSALAHGGGQHLMGVVKAVDDKGLVMETKDKRELKVVFDEKTKFVKAGAPSSAKELRVGERVVVHTAKKPGAAELVAVLVKFDGAPHGGEHPG